MTIKPQILAAISGALTAYLEEEAACLAAASASLGVAAGFPTGPGVSLYALSGRQEAMQLRQLMQRRSLR